jgi:uncharacterized membrane protein
MDQRLARVFSAAWWAAVVLLIAQIVTTSSLRYVMCSEAPPPPIVANAFATPFLLIHVVTGVIALVVGPLQFVRRIRMRVPALHRATGRIYVGACAVSAPAEFMLALGTTAGPVAAAGFAVQALLLPLFTYFGWRAAVERRFADHREWMLRSYALTSAAITLRLMLPASGLLGLEFLPAYQAISWLAWTTNLVLFEYYIRRKRVSTTSYPTLATA